MNVIAIPGFSEPISSWLHLIVAACSLFGIYPLLQRGQKSPLRVFSLTLYTFTLVFLFSMSGIFHLLEPGGEARAVLQRLDHAGIWALIAGTFTPIHLILFRRFWRWGIILTIWSIAITGLVLEVVYFKDFPEWLALSLYLGLGWVGVVTIRRFHIDFGHPSYRFLVYGGVYYSIGAILEFLRWPILIDGVIGPHEIFHVFVVLGAYAHWKFIYYWCYYPVNDFMEFKVQIFPDGQLIARSIKDQIVVKATDMEALKKNLEESLKYLYRPNKCSSYKLNFFKEEIIKIDH